MDITIRRVEDFIPAWDKNKKAEVPIVFKLKFLTAEEFDDCYTITPQELDIHGKKVRGGGVVVDRRKLLVYAVIEIQNFNVLDEDGNKTAIKTAQDLLLCPGVEDLFFEVIAHIRAMEARVNSKK